MAISPRLAGLTRSRKVWYSVAASIAIFSTAAFVPMSSASAATVPANKGSVAVSKKWKVTGNFDAGMKRYYGSGPLGKGGQEEGGSPIFELADGATLKNAIIGFPGADGVHCVGSCTLENVWWEDVGEDAATFKPTSRSQVMTVRGGGALHASDKVLQHNGVGGTMIIDGFQVEDFGKLYRSCGNCESAQGKRDVILKNITATFKGSLLVGINENYGDTATFSNITIVGDTKKKIGICQRFIGNQTGKEPKKAGSGPDGKHCKYQASDIRYR